MPQISHLKVNDLKATIVFVEGTYSHGMQAGDVTPKPNYAFLGAIVEGSEGNVFLKLVGPKNTVQKSREPFNQLINSAKSA